MNGDHRRVGAVFLPIEVMADRPLVNDEEGPGVMSVGR
jgi:hypothetical protein